MRLAPSIAIFAIGSQVAAAIPHRHGRRHEHAKKGVSAEVVTEYTTVTVAATDLAVIVWVDNKGNIVSTETRADLGAVPTVAPETTSITSTTTPLNTPAAAPVESSSVPPISAPSTETPPPLSAVTEALAPTPAPQTTSTANDGNVSIDPGVAAVPNGGSSEQGGSGLGIAYDLIDDSGACRSADTVESDFDNFASGNYGMVRIYDTDCNAVQLVTAQAAKRGMRVIAGIGNNHLVTDLAANIGLLIAQAGPNLGVIDTIAVGNEYVGSGGPVSDVLAALSLARTALAGVYAGSIVTVDVFDILISTPQLCAASDYCAANCHAYFTDSIPAPDAGAYVQQQAANVAAANGGKRTVITESGWPWKSLDASNTRASEANQEAAIGSLRSSFSSDLFLFQAYDTTYKTGVDTTEWYYGLYYHND